MTNSEAVSLLMNNQYYEQGYKQGASDTLNKIRAEIQQTSETVDGFLMHDGTKRTVLQIIYKYKAESEAEE